MREIRLSYSAWSRFKNCPRSYRLRYLDRVASRSDNWHTVVGTVVSKQSEAFFKLSPAERSAGWFGDTFDTFWQAAIEPSNDPNGGRWIDWMQRGRDLLGAVPSDNEAIFRAAYMNRRADTLDCSRRLAEMVQMNNLMMAEALPELSFEVRVEPEPQHLDQPWAPILVLNGFIDLVVKRNGVVDVWDWKVTKSPSRLDADQLAVYTLAVQHGGAVVDKVGFLLVRQLRVMPQTITPILQYDLLKRMRQIGVCYEVNEWPANPAAWRCRGCDVVSACDAAKLGGPR